jgi:hypothetical protein
MVLNVVLFLSVILVLTIGAHLLFGKAVLRLFMTNSSGLKISLFIVLFLLFHTPTNMIPGRGDGLDRHFATYWVPDTTFFPAQKLGVDLQLSGHTHAGQIFPFGYLTQLIYKGYDYGLRGLGVFSIYTTCGVGTWGPSIRTGNSQEIVVIIL